MAELTKIFCVIPAYNEEKNIAWVIDLVKPEVAKIVIVDDCSADKTWSIIRRLAEDNQVSVLHHSLNRGQGAALQTGTEYALAAGAEIIVHFDADGQFSAAEIKDLAAPILAGEAEVVLGSRFLGKESNMPWFKKNILFPAARLVNRFSGIVLTDPQSGFRALSRSAAQKIQISQDGSAHCSEILSKLFRYRLKVKEVPITVVYHEFGQSLFGGKGNGMGGLRIIKDLILAKFID